MNFKSSKKIILNTLFLFISLINNVKCDVGDPLMLTPYLEIGDFEMAKQVSEVNSSYLLDVKSYAGFITVDKELNSNMWFWYFPVQDEAEDAPFVIWLQGGPGVSSLYGLFHEVGPFLYENDTLTKNPESWHLRNSILFIDNPVGAGFSFTDEDEGYSTNQTQVTANLYKFLQQFYQIFPELQPIPMFLSGESYAGKYIPFLAYEIHNRNLIEKTKINLKGITIGDGWIDPPNLYQMSSLAYQVGLIGIQQEAEMKVLENKVKLAIEQDDWQLAFETRMGLVLYIANAANLQNLFNYLDDGSYTNNPPYEEFINSEIIRDAVHVGNVSHEWLSEPAFMHLIADNMKSAKNVLEILLEHYPILFYNGQLDLAVPYANLLKVYNSLNWTGAENFRNAKRKPWSIEGKVVGYEKRAGNFYELFFRNSGHCVAKEKPELLRIKITEFINNNSQLNKSKKNENKVVDDRENFIDSDTLESSRRKRNIL